MGDQAQREETTLDEVLRRAREGDFYADYDWAAGPALRALERAVAPVPMILHCPTCGTQHIDKVDPINNPGWENPPHTSHKCLACGCIWRPADIPTAGVAAIATMGKTDTWAPCSGGGVHVVSRNCVVLGPVQADAAVRLERGVHESQSVPLYDRGDYLAGIMATVAGALFGRPARTPRDICAQGPTDLAIIAGHAETIADAGQ